MQRPSELNLRKRSTAIYHKYISTTLINSKSYLSAIAHENEAIWGDVKGKQLFVIV